MSNNDNFLLTVLGAVGIGALVMGLNQKDCNEPIQENYDGMTTFGFQRVKERVMVDKSGCVRAVNFAQPMPGAQELDKRVAAIAQSSDSEAEKKAKLAKVNEQGTRQLYQAVAKQASIAQSSRGNPARAARAAEAANPNTLQQVSFAEKYEPDYRMGLGAGTVTEPYYVSYGEFAQTVPERSPSLNLGRDIRYNPPSTDLMGISDAYQNLPQNQFGSNGTQIQPMAPSSTIEHYNMITENYADESQRQAPFMAGIQKFPGNNYMADKASMVKAVATGNAEFAEVGPIVIAPLTCQEGCDENAESLIPLGPGAQDNVQIFDRVMTVPLKPGWRQHSAGDVDFIRGDLPVCVDPCQAGWFQSSLKPQFLQVGALDTGVISNSGVGKFVAVNGGNAISMPDTLTAQDMRVKASVASSAVVSTASLP